jgi:outer membrane biosynthesis protein TonB
MDIVKLVGQFATPAVLDYVAKLLGVPPAAAQKGLGAAIPGVLAGLLGASKRPGFADTLGQALSGAGGLGDLVGSEPAAAATRGSDLLSSLLGPDAAATLSGALGSYAGVPKAGAGSLLGLAGSMALGALGKEATAKGLDARGVLGLLEGSKDEISAALPADFANSLGASGLFAGFMPKAAAAAPQPAAPRVEPARTPPPPPPPAKKSGWTRWLLWLVVLALLAWLLMRLFAPEPEPVVEAPAPAPEATAPAPAPAPEPEPAAPPATEPATAPAPATPAPADSAATPASPLVVGGVDIGASVSTALSTITSTFEGITDAASAQAALPRLTEARDALAGVETAAAGLPAEGRTALQQMVSTALPAIRTGAERLKADGAIAAVVGPVVDDILARLTAFAG